MSQRLATIISYTHYQDNALQPFNLPEPDIDALVTTLLDPDIGNFDKVDTFVDRPASEVLNYLAGLFKYRKPYDLICVYYAGLGIIDRDGQVYLATIDSDLISLADSAIPAAELNGWMDRSFSRQQILIFDSYFLRVNIAGDQAMVLEGLDPVEAFRGKGYWRLVISSSAKALPLQKENLVLANSTSPSFTDLIIRGLETGEADVDKDGLIGLRELYTYLKQEMQRRRMSQKPYLYSFLEKEDFVLAKAVTVARETRPIKWDVLSGAITLPIAILIIGGKADIILSIEATVIFLLFYAVLYRYGD